MKRILSTIIAVGIAGFFSVAQAQENPAAEASNLDELLEMVRQGRLSETAEHRAREAEFIAQRSRQQQLLASARQDRVNEERRSTTLERRFQNNENQIDTLTARLQARLGSLSELFGVLQQVAGDTRGVFQGSMISIHYPDREAVLTSLIQKASEGTQLPSIEEIESLWFEMQREMTESGKIVRLPYRVFSADGQTEEVQLIRVGDFNLVANGKYYTLDGAQVHELQRQPVGRYTDTVEDLEEAGAGELVTFGIDPSRGQLLSILVQAPSLRERIDQGREVGYLIIVMGVVGILFVLERIFYLFTVTGKVRRQMRSDTPSDKNPLGRILQVYHENRNVDVETLELKLDEAILKETPALERFLTIIKIISAVAPLFGLLGTVTGMIATFQAITLFGAGDPKLMADGISQALVTTVLGLTVAIPTLLLHSFVASMSKRVIHILEEQSAGIIAVHAEKEAAHGGAA
jgi:biopolymer transport protein ExbB